MNAKHAEDAGGRMPDDGLDQQQGAMGVAAQAALGDGIVGGTDGQADAMGAARQAQAQDGDPSGEAGADYDRVVEGQASDEEIGLAPGESD